MTASAGMLVDAGSNPYALPPTLRTAPAETSASSPTGASLITLQTHLNRLQAIQAVCESPAQLPGFHLSSADVRLSLKGLDRYFAPLFASRQVTLEEVNETVQWVEARFPAEQLLEDIIQALWAPLLKVQYEARRAAKGGRYEHH